MSLSETSDEDRDMALMLLNMGAEAGGRLDPARFERRRPGSSSRRAFDLCLQERWIGRDGWIQPLGYSALEDWNG